MGKKESTNVDAMVAKLAKEERQSETKKDVNLAILASVVSATLRMVVPTLGLFFVGLVIDFWLQQTAFYAIIGAGIGFVIAAILIYFQVRKIRTKGHGSLLVNDHDGIIKTKKKKSTEEKK